MKLAVEHYKVTCSIDAVVYSNVGKCTEACTVVAVDHNEKMTVP